MMSERPGMEANTKKRPPQRAAATKARTLTLFIVRTRGAEAQRPYTEWGGRGGVARFDFTLWQALYSQPHLHCQTLCRPGVRG